MSRSRWAVSLFLVWYLSALFVAALPVPGVLPTVDAIRYPDANPLTSRFTPILDALGIVLSPLPGALWTATSSFRPVTGGLLNRVGMAQRWDMFADPRQYDEYLRIGYYMSSGSRGTNPSRNAAELVLPAHREERVRLIRSFWDFSRDEALMAVVTRYHPKSFERSGLQDPEYREALRPVVRYFRDQFQKHGLRGDERVVRVEVWHGTADTPPRELSDEGRARERARLTILADYYAGLVEGPVTSSALPAYLAHEQEADISWTLEFIEEG